MRRFVAPLSGLVMGMVLGQMFNVVSSTAETGDGGAGSSECSGKNGDVNGDGEVDLSDAITILGYAFLGNPASLMPLCQGSGCGGAEGRYVDRGDGTVTDCETGLVWQQATAPGSFNWWEAGIYCENLVLGVHDNWRLPTEDELLSLVDRRYMPKIDPVFAAEPVWYWSSTSSSHDPETAALIVSFDDGVEDVDVKGHVLYVRAVRCGSCGQ